MDIRRLLTYADHCRQQLQETLETHPDALHTSFETIAEYRTVGELIAHCIGAEQRWTEQRIQGQPGTARYETCAAKTLVGLFADWAHIRAKTRAVIEEWHDPSHRSQMHREIAFTLPQWGHTDTLTVEEMVFQVFNHQIFHLGQISMALQQQGIDPPNFDYVFLHRDPEDE